MTKVKKFKARKVLRSWIKIYKMKYLGRKN